MQAHDRLIVAADLSSRDDILRLADELHGVAGVLKIGLQAFVANGPALVREVVARGQRVFLDLKIHDIPNTAQHAVQEAANLGAHMVTVHASGGAAMLRACANDVSSRAAKTVEGSPASEQRTGCLDFARHDTVVLGVTILTSLDDDELRGIGFPGTPLQNAVRLASLAKHAGLRGVVASPLEIAAIREACGPDLAIVTPGIRPAGSDAGDQRRTMTARDAVAAGADYVVVGRPITAAGDRRAAAVQIVDEIASAR